MVCTFGDIAEALGDPRAARAVGEVLATVQGQGLNGHRVVYSDGRAPDAEALRVEGLHVVDGRVEGLDEVRFHGFEVRPVLRDLQREQEELRLQVVEKDGMTDHKKVTGVDIAYLGEEAVAAAVTMEAGSGKVLEEVVEWGRVRFPYVPGYLAYRELPMVRKAVRCGSGHVHLIDGHGRLHPRCFGVACHIGVSLGIPTVGAAKSMLIGHVMEGGGDIMVDGEVRGRMVGSGGKPTYVSVGHRVSLDTACHLVKRLILRAGPPEPLRMAHILATEERRRRSRA
jgi:deoxyribonuclease V